MSKFFTKLNDAKLLRLPKARWDPSWATKPWYKDDEFYEFHRVQGNITDHCIYLCKVIKSFIDSRKLVLNGTSLDPNTNLQVYQNLLTQWNVKHVGITRDYNKDFPNQKVLYDYGTQQQ